MDARVLRRLALLAVLLAGFALVARGIPAHGGTAADVAVARWFRGVETDAGAVFFTWVSWLGDTALAGFLAATVVSLVHRRRWPAAGAVVFTSLGGMLLNGAIKPVFHRPRPEYAVELLAGTSWSFPSGHAMASLIGFGVLAYFRREVEENPHRRHLILATACVVIVAVGVSRLYLGVHYFTDVVGGFLAGAAWLALCLEAYRAWRARGHPAPRRQSPPAR